MRIHLYIDDLGLNNPLGSAKKKHCITVVYFQVVNLEQNHLSNLRSSHVACIAKSIHVKKNVLEKVLDRLCKVINLLQSEG